ncbi:hypothetical protein BDN72DRAFT_111167 [Pluteus cervinus]|uniref:Uncharacterized protein n=1 Tax=Pluteus cervinus TaxID=181527 RepID=A0ACD2ZYV3_9AGAR|nr:hypothetical protein BDN72DRAFT_111167 [Pluteus cervinus]
MIDTDLLALCRMIKQGIDGEPERFARQWHEWEQTRPTSVKILKLILWLRAMLLGLLNHPHTLGAITQMFQEPLQELTWVILTWLNISSRLTANLDTDHAKNANFWGGDVRKDFKTPWYRSIFRFTSFSPFARNSCLVVINALFCITVLVNARLDLYLILLAFYAVINGLLHLLFRFNLHRTTL